MNPSLNRRQFFQSAARYGFLTGLTALTAGGELKRRRLENDPNCIRTYTCADCLEYGRCDKPKARDFERSQR